jgi:hypothetical protein
MLVCLPRIRIPVAGEWPATIDRVAIILLSIGTYFVSGLAWSNGPSARGLTSATNQPVPENIRGHVVLVSL